MIKSTTTKILSYTLVAVILMSSPGALFAAHTSTDAFTTQGRTLVTLPSGAIVGSSQERRDAYNSLTDAQKTAANNAVKSMATGRATKPANKTVTLSFADISGNRVETGSQESVDDSSDFYGQTGCGATCVDGGPLEDDLDGDGLPESFENSLADGFTPYYYVSSGENSGTGFATFNNSLPLTVAQSFGPTPPISYFRAKPLGFYYRNDGIRYGLVQLDFLTLWNKDDGLRGGDLCAVTPIIDTTALSSHPLNRERSALLVAAPVVNSAYDSDVTHYKLYEAWTAAHESTLFDHSMYFNLSTPVAFNNHVELGLSLSKHGTYVFNPDMYPLTPDYIIAATYGGISAAYFNGSIDYLTYLAYMFIADQTFFECVVERFHDQGGTYASTRINVGELTHPINNAGFILDTELANKLGRLFY